MTDRLDSETLEAAQRQAVTRMRMPQPDFVTLVDVERYYGHVQWAWQGWLPKGHVTLLAGEQGTGKSYLLAYLLAVLVGGQQQWPDKQPFLGEPTKAMLCDTEEFRGEHASRMAAMGARNGRVILPSPKGEVTYMPRLPKDAKLIERVAVQEECGIIAIDSLSGGHGLEENSADMRKVLQSLVGLAGRLQVPVIVAHHTRKRQQFEPARVTLDRIRGSNVISQFCRSVLGLWRLDGTDEGSPVRVESVKNSFSKPAKPFGFTITGEGLQFCEAPQEERTETTLDRARELLAIELRPGPRAYSDLLALAESDGIGKSTLYRARDLLGIVAKRGKWALPAHSQDLLIPIP